MLRHGADHGGCRRNPWLAESGTPILSHWVTVTPDTYFINWQQDLFSHYLGRRVFPEKTELFRLKKRVGAISGKVGGWQARSAADAV
jgi:hypothetical protein